MSMTSMGAALLLVRLVMRRAACKSLASAGRAALSRKYWGALTQERCCCNMLQSCIITTKMLLQVACLFWCCWSWVSSKCFGWKQQQEFREKYKDDASTLDRKGFGWMVNTVDILTVFGLVWIWSGSFKLVGRIVHCAGWCWVGGLVLESCRVDASFCGREDFRTAWRFAQTVEKPVLRLRFSEVPSRQFPNATWSLEGSTPSWWTFYWQC